MAPLKIAVLSAGTWGITLASLLFRKGLPVGVWEFSPDVVAELVRARRHPKLPDLKIPPDLPLTPDLAEALTDCETLVCVVPAAHVRSTFHGIAEVGYRGQLVVICSKGIEQGTHALLTRVVQEELGEGSQGRVGLLTGPSHAEEVSRNMPTAVIAAAPDLTTAETIRELFSTKTFRIYTQTDVVGVELAASLKNVIAIACGISDGLGFGDNSKAALITRGLSEIIRLGMKLGARRETFSGLAGIGDLVVTCMSRHSRNWQFGNLLGKGNGVQEALEKVGMVVEGYHTVRAAVELAVDYGVEMPISEAVGEIIFGEKNPAAVVASLMSREPKSEMEE